MKQLLLIAALIMGAAFGQLRYNAKAFYGDISVLTVSNYTLLGSIPGGAILTGIKIGESVKSTNTESTNSIQIGIKTSTNYFVGSVQVPMQIVPTPLVCTLTNGYKILSATDPTGVYAYLTRVGAANTAIGTLRIVVEYLQK